MTPCLKKGGDECFSYGGLSKFNAILGGGPSYIVHPSDLAPALVVLDARVAISGPSGRRTLSLAEFFTLPAESDVTRENVLAANEVVLGVGFSAPGEGWSSTYLKFRAKIDLVPLARVTEALHNPYGIMTVNPAKHSAINADLAPAFVDFMISAKAQQLITDYKLEGEQLFHPSK